MRRLAVVAGLTGPVLFAGMLLILTILEYDFERALGWHPLYAPTFDWPSGLALGPYGSWMTGTFVLSGALLSAFALGLRADLGPASDARRGTACLAFAGLGMASLGFFQTDPTVRSTPATWHGVLHDVSFVALGLALAAAMIFLARAFRREPRWASMALPTWAALAFAVPAFVLKGLAFYPFLASFLIWSEWMAWHSRKTLGH